MPQKTPANKTFVRFTPPPPLRYHLRTVAIMKKLNLLSINQINAQIKLTETWKAINNDKVIPINSLKIKQKEGDRKSRSATNGNLMELGTSNMARQTFINDSARVWNRAPQTIKNCSSLSVQRKKLRNW